MLALRCEPSRAIAAVLHSARKSNVRAADQAVVFALMMNVCDEKRVSNPMDIYQTGALLARSMFDMQELLRDTVRVWRASANEKMSFAIDLLGLGALPRLDELLVISEDTVRVLAWSESNRVDLRFVPEGREYQIRLMPMSGNKAVRLGEAAEEIRLPSGATFPTPEPRRNGLAGFRVAVDSRLKHLGAAPAPSRHVPSRGTPP